LPRGSYEIDTYDRRRPGGSCGPEPPGFAAARFFAARRRLILFVLSALSPVLSFGGPAPLDSQGSVGLLPSGGDPWRRELKGAVEGSLAFLAERQLKDSGVLGARYQVAVTSLAGLAFLGAGYGYERGKYGPNIALCVKYITHVATHGDVSPGYIARAGEDHSMYGQGYAILFLTQVFGELPLWRQKEVRVIIRKGIEAIARARSWRGGWYYGPLNDRHRDENSVTVCVLQALRAARNVGFVVDKDLIDGAEEYLKSCQNPDGSFQYSKSGNVTWSSYELTCGAVASLQALGRYHSAEVKRGLDYLRRSLSRVAPRYLDAASRYSFYGNFYAAQTFHLAGGDLWRKWYPAALKQLIGSGKREGPTLRWEDRLGFGTEYATAMAVLTLEVPLGYLPIFQK